MRATVSALLVIVMLAAGCSEHARIFSQAKIGMSASQVRGLEGYGQGGTYVGNEQKRVSFYPGEKPEGPEGRPEGCCYVVVVAGDGTVTAKGYLDLQGQDHLVLVMRARDLQEFQKVQEKVGVPSDPGNPTIRPSHASDRLSSGVCFEDWQRLSDCLMGWPFARRSNDLRSYAAHGGEIPWDEFLAQAQEGTLNTGCQDDVIGVRGRSPSRYIVGGYFRFLGLRIGGGTTSRQHPVNWND